MDFASIPDLVLNNYLLSKLERNDLLRLRRVCRGTKEVVDNFLNLKENVNLAPEIEIDEVSKNLGKFLDMGIPTTRIYLNNVSGDDFYENTGEDGVAFLERFGPLVKHLRVHQLSIFFGDKEWDFLKSFVNLESFEATLFRGWSSNFKVTATLLRAQGGGRKLEGRRGTLNFPENFRQLKKVKIGNRHVQDYDKGKWTLQLREAVMYTKWFLRKSESLECASLPLYWNRSNPSFPNPENWNLLEYAHPPFPFAVALISELITRRSLANPPVKNLQFFDFEGSHDNDWWSDHWLQHEWEASELFLELCSLCLKHGVKLLNVAPYWFRSLTESVRFNSPDLGTPVISIVNLHPCLLVVDLSNLESIVINSTSRSCPGPEGMLLRPLLPALKVLDITVDSMSCGFAEWDNTTHLANRFEMDGEVLMKFLFQDVVRASLIELRLNFKKDAGEVVVPRVEDIVSACPNLKKLTLINWPGTNRTLHKLWRGLPALEEISLENCRALGNEAFVGDDIENPVFLQLKNLRKLTLKGLDKMPKITDTVFTLVIRHLKLTHLNLTSDKPLEPKTITILGVRFLLTGDFAKSIQKFSFGNWSIANISAEEWKQLEKRFRSHDML